MRSFGAGRVEASNSPAFKVGDVVLGLVGWQDYVVTKPVGLTKLPPGAPIELAMGVLGMIGMTAYFGLLDVGRPVAGETVVVSGAAGATGSLVGQIAKIKGCRVDRHRRRSGEMPLAHRRARASTPRSTTRRRT